MKITLIILLLVFAIYIGYRIAKRMATVKDPDGKPGCVMYGYVILVYLCMCGLSFPFICWTVSAFYGSVVHTRYEATVTSVREYEDEDDDGNRHTMYAPTVIITTNDGIVVERELAISSGEEYLVGELHPVTYDASADELSSRSFSTVALLSAGLVMALMMLGYVIIGFAYAYSIPIGFTGVEYTVFIFLYVIAPIGMIAMDAALIYYLVQALYYNTKADDPAWVLWLVGFFAFFLTMAMIGIVRMWWVNKKQKEKPV